MVEEIGRQLIASGFLPHGYCLSWSPPLVSTYLISDFLIFLAYFSMPLALGYFARRRPDFPYKWLLWMFAAFILACGTTHLMGTVILWQPLYWVDAILKAVTAVISVATAIALWPLIPHALRAPSHRQMRAINTKLEAEITERQRVEEELRRANEQLLQLHRSKDTALANTQLRLDAHLSNSPLGTLELDPDFRVTRWSEMAEHLFGWRADEVVGRALVDMRWVHEEDQERVYRVAADMQSGISRRNKVVNRNYCKDGAVLYCEWYNSAIYDDGGKLVSILSQVLDITERVRAEEIRKVNEERFRAFFNTTAVGAAMLSLSGRFIEVNEHLCQITGYSAEELLSMTPKDLTHPEDWMSENPELSAYLQGQSQRHHLEKRYVRKDGRIVWVQVDASLVHDANGQALCSAGIIQDITQRKQATSLLADYNAQLEATVASRTAELVAANRELEGFTFATSHDLKSPLSRISSFSALLESRYGDRLEGEGQQFLYFIRQNSIRLMHLVDDLLNHARMAQGALELGSVAVEVLVRTVLDEKFDEIRDAGAEVHLLLEPAQIFGDPAALSQALGNLVENAIKYSASDVASVIEIGGTVKDDRYHLSVRDNGIGFDMVYHDKIFEIFRRLHTYSEYPGTGVGLALVRRAMERMGGKVWAESTPGQGATFYLEFRLAIECMSA